MQLNTKRGSVIESATQMQLIAARLGVQATVVGVSASAVNDSKDGGGDGEENEVEVEDKLFSRFVRYLLV